MRTAARAALAFVVGLLLTTLVALPILALTVRPALAAPAAESALQVPLAAQQHLGPLRREAQRVWGLDAPVATFAAQLHQESRWNPNARSSVGALGLAQFMPATSAWISTLDADLGANAPLNPTWALRAVVVYDRWLYQRIRLGDASAPGASCQRMAYTLASYNGGLGWTYKRQALSATPDICLGVTCTINPGIAPASQRENEHYPRVILGTESAFTRWGAGSCL